MAPFLQDSSQCRGIRLDGNACKTLRKILGLTQERLAAASRGPHSVSLATVKRAESGAAIDLASALSIAALFQTLLSAIRLADELAASVAPTPIRQQATPGPRKVGIAVMPFELLGCAPGQVDSAYFSDGLMDDLLCRLSRWWFPVISRCSSAQYRDGRYDPRRVGESASRRVGEELGARYLVTGSIRREGARVCTSMMASTKPELAKRFLQGLAAAEKGSAGIFH